MRTGRSAQAWSWSPPLRCLGAEVGVADLAMRVGIVTGEVAVTVGAQMQGMVAGDPVNTASRVQSAAAPGQVWVDETTRLLTSASISYADVGSHVLKGKTEPMPLWAARAVVATAGGGQRADGLEAPLVGRDRDLRMVKELFHGVAETGRPALAPGLGRRRGREDEAGLGVLQVHRRARRCLPLALRQVRVVRRGCRLLRRGRGSPQPARDRARHG